MSETIKKSIPKPMEFYSDGRRFLQYGISPVKLAAIKAQQKNGAKSAKRDPVIKDGIPYVRTAEGKIVRLEHFDPDTMEKFTLTPNTVLTKEKADRMREFAVMPVVVDDECPELTDDQISTILQKAIEQKKAQR